MLLRLEGDAIVGEAGHAARRFLPVGDHAVPDELSGSWRSTEGAEFTISGSSLTMGIGPTRRSMPLTALGNGRFLFTLLDGPWTKRICLNQLSDSRIELVASRARMIEYSRSL